MLKGMHIFMDCFQTRPNSLIDSIATNNGYGWKIPYANLLTHSHTSNLEMLSHLKMRGLII